MFECEAKFCFISTITIVLIRITICFSITKTLTYLFIYSSRSRQGLSSFSSNNMAKKGKLLFKGDNKRPKKKSKKSKTDREETTTKDSGSTQAVVVSAPTTSHRMAVAASATATTAATTTIQTGTGTISTSGTVVTGHDTKFEKEISIGDAILVTIHSSSSSSNNNSNNTEEMRVVTMRLSNASLNLSSAFSENLRAPQSFRYVRKPRNMAQERKKERQAQLEEAGAVERNAFDIYGSGDKTTEVFTYREKTETGSYRVKQQQVSSSSSSQLTTRGGMLNLRSKKTSDKYC